ncbi:GntR family transcriptional regulator [Leekyejoonella antrihumi]|uniref:GntR family transcriptional regulator n=1 Tax=Leekyejoonella antrihumi TaxID=1660198 RepID=UPI001FEBBC18|nr:GntR family transcriptional regulator [Leekyejoonella antrihumi]
MTSALDETLSLARQAYLRIREGIIRGDHQPGSRLRERDLSEALQMSRIPIREALRRLENEGYIVTYPNRGAVVSQLTLKDVAELFDLRLSLEVLAARQAAAAIAEGRASTRLSEVLAEAGTATTAHDPAAIQLANTDFHAAVIEMSGNDLLIATMAPLLGRIRWLLALTADRDPQVEYTEHVRLYDAILQGNPELAGAVAFAHIEHGRAPSLAALAEVLPPA